jgi:hypothetical protein
MAIHFEILGFNCWKAGLEQFSDVLQFKMASFGARISARGVNDHIIEVQVEPWFSTLQTVGPMQLLNSNQPCVMGKHGASIPRRPPTALHLLGLGLFAKQASHSFNSR